MLGLAACGGGVAAAGTLDPRHAGQPAAAEATLILGQCRKASFDSGCEVFTWPITGTLRGELKATLRRFADGKEEVLGVASYGVDEQAIAGQLLLLCREGAPLGQAGERFVEFRMPVEPDLSVKAKNGTASAGVQSASVQPLGAWRLPTTPRQAQTWCTGGSMKCLPDHGDAVEMWSETHALAVGEVSQLIPWSVQQQFLLAHCKDGVVSVVMTLEVDPAGASVPRQVR